MSAEALRAVGCLAILAAALSCRARDPVAPTSSAAARPMMGDPSTQCRADCSFNYQQCTLIVTSQGKSCGATFPSAAGSSDVFADTCARCGEESSRCSDECDNQFPLPPTVPVTELRGALSVAATAVATGVQSGDVAAAEVKFKPESFEEARYYQTHRVRFFELRHEVALQLLLALEPLSAYDQGAALIEKPSGRASYVRAFIVADNQSGRMRKVHLALRVTTHSPAAHKGATTAPIHEQSDRVVIDMSMGSGSCGGPIKSECTSSTALGWPAPQWPTGVRVDVESLDIVDGAETL